MPLLIFGVVRLGSFGRLVTLLFWLWPGFAFRGVFGGNARLDRDGGEAHLGVRYGSWTQGYPPLRVLLTSVGRVQPFSRVVAFPLPFLGPLLSFGGLS